jgi:hypothetical protein
MPLAAKSSNPFYGKPHTRNHFRRAVCLFDFCHGAAGKILKQMMPAAFDMRRLRQRRQAIYWPAELQSGSI